MVDVIDDGSQTALIHMRRDYDLIEQLPHLEKPVIRFYDWESPSLTYGCFISIEDHIFVDQTQFALAKRPTGGGILFHTYDVSFSVAIPAHHPTFSDTVLDNYQLINRAALQAVQDVQHELSLTLDLQGHVEPALRNFCMATSTQYDLLFHGRKIGGAAQRKTQFGFVHQGSIFVAPFEWDAIRQVLREGDTLIQAMQKTSTSLLKDVSEDEIILVRKRLKQRLEHHLRYVLLSPVH